ncbi:MAG: type II toxin-antitoxin system RelE/ParE family toxin [Gemmataceae bacterium]
MPPARLTPEARNDLAGAHAWFDSRRPGGGDRFLDEVRRVLDLAEQHPGLYTEVSDGVRAAPLSRFGYVIYYREAPAEVVVIAVRHGHEEPSVWQGRTAP